MMRNWPKQIAALTKKYSIYIYTFPFLSYEESLQEYQNQNILPQAFSLFLISWSQKGDSSAADPGKA